VKQWYIAMMVIALIGAIVWVVAFMGHWQAGWDMAALDIAAYGLYAVVGAILGAIVPAGVWLFSTTDRLRENIPPPPQ